MSLSTTSTGLSGETGRPSSSAASGIITTTFNTSWATWTAVIDVEHSTTIALYQDGTSVVQTPLPSSTRPPRPRPSPPGSSGPAPSSLYLLTFAVTLSLLLSISLSILFRNVVQRSRARRIREAVAAGLIPPESLNWIYRAQFGLPGLGRSANNGGGRIIPTGSHGPRPMLWDSWLASDDTEKGYNTSSEKGAAAWAGISPLSVAPLTNATLALAQAAPPPQMPRRTFIEIIFHLPPMPYIPPSPPTDTAPASAPGTNLSPEEVAEQERAREEHMIAELFREPTSLGLPSAPVTASNTPQTASGIRVALLIAMPRDPRRAQPRQTGAADGEGGLEDVDVVLGTSDVRWDRPPAQSSATTASDSAGQ